MVRSTAPTVDAYLAELPEDRRAVVARVRDVIRSRLPAGYEEAMNWGMISYEVPLSRYPDTYNRQPLSYVALAAQKNGYSLYLNCVYQDPALLARLRQGFAASGKRLDMGKSCVRFKRVDDLPLDVVGDMVAAVPPDAFIARYEQARDTRPAG